MSVGEGMEQNGSEIVIHHRGAILRPAPVRLLVLIKESLADEIALVILVDTSPPLDGVP